MRTIAFYINKGGCGKTVSTVNTATVLAQRGFRVLVIDFNPQCDTTRYVIRDEADIDVSIDDLIACDHKADLDHLCEAAVVHTDLGWDILPGRKDRLDPVFVALQLDAMKEQTRILKKIVRRYRNRYDFCIIDTHNTADLKLLNICALEPEIIAPVKIDEGALVSVYGVDQFLEAIGSEDSHDLHPTLKILFTCVNRNKTDRMTIEEIRQAGKWDVFDTTIRNQPKLVTECSLQHRALVNEPVRRRNGIPIQTVGDDYRTFVDELLGMEG